MPILDSIVVQVILRSGKTAIDFVVNRFRKKTTQQIMAERFDTLLQSHSVNGAQLLGLIPRDWGWKAADVLDANALVSNLQEEHLKWFANTFNVQHDWLAGVAAERCSMPFWGYKNLPKLGKTMAQNGWLSPDLKMTILSRDYRRENRSLSFYVIVFSIPICSGEDSTYKHALFEKQWDWHHPPCLLDTKAVARWFCTKHNPYATIPIVSVTYEELEGLVNGRLLPGKFVPVGHGGFDHFEDRVLTNSESRKAIETHQTQVIIDYLDTSRFLESVGQADCVAAT